MKSVADPKKAEDESTLSLFIANAHNELYRRLIEKKILSQ